MENRGSKIVAIVALCVGVVGLSLGFAAFSNTLTISSSATVSPSADTFKVIFDKSVAVNCTGTATATSTGTVEDTTISGIAVAFTNPGESITCTATIKNDGEYEAFLNSITSGKVTCSSEDTTITTDLMNAACDSIEVTATVGADSATATTKADMANSAITGNSMAAKTGTQQVSLTIAYNGPARADGAFTVSVPSVTLTYSSVD